MYKIQILICDLMDCTPIIRRFMASRIGKFHKLQIHGEGNDNYLEIEDDAFLQRITQSDSVSDWLWTYSLDQQTYAVTVRCILTASPTNAPSTSPTLAPSDSPSNAPTDNPTSDPTTDPTIDPTSD